MERQLPKMKTHTGAKKRFKVTGSGRLVHARAGKAKKARRMLGI